MLHVGLIDLHRAYVIDYINVAIEKDHVETIEGIPASYFTIETLDKSLVTAQKLNSRRCWNQLSGYRWEIVKVNDDCSLIQALAIELGLSLLSGSPSGKFMLMIQMFPVDRLSTAKLQTLVNIVEYEHAETKSELLKAFGVTSSISVQYG